MKPAQIHSGDAERIDEIVLAIATKDHDRMARIAALEILGEEHFWPYLDRMDVTFIAPPADHLALASIFGDPKADEWIGIDLPLWSKEEGRSDYTLTLDIDLRSSPHRIVIKCPHIL